MAKSPSRGSATGTTMSHQALETARRAMRWIVAAFYLPAGILHFTIPGKFLLITPDWVPFPRQVIFITGLCEIAGSLALITSRLRWWAGVMLALYAVGVFPANVKHAIAGIDLPPLSGSWWYHAPRLMFQPVLVWWALFCAGVVDWPFRGMPDASPRA
jgi:uncharacterized membrane protein